MERRLGQQTSSPFVLGGWGEEPQGAPSPLCAPLTWVSLYDNFCWRKGFAYVTGQQGMPLKLIANVSNGHELYGVELSV